MNTEEFDHFIQTLRSCRICEERLDPNPVFLGNQNAKIFHISQAPSLTVSKTMRPFSDASGKKLRDDWYQITEETFYNPDNFCFGAIGLCYPGKNKSGGDKQPPAVCAKTWLDPALLDRIDNQLYILIGKKAADHFFKGKDFADLIFNDQEIRGKKALVLPHPSPLNIKWYKDHPAFYETRVAEIRMQIQQTLRS